MRELTNWQIGSLLYSFVDIPYPVGEHKYTKSSKDKRMLEVVFTSGIGLP